MKTTFAIVLLSILMKSFGHCQDTDTYQLENIYKQNKVKLRKWYMGTNKSLFVTTSYDTNGRLIKYQLEPSIDGTLSTTYYFYDENKLSNIIDTIRYGKPDMAQIKKLKSMGLNIPIKKRPKGAPEFETTKYTVEYSDTFISKLTSYNSDRSINSIIYYENGGTRTANSFHFTFHSPTSD